jgi:hypothetical protein
MFMSFVESLELNTTGGGGYWTIMLVIRFVT